MCRACERPAPDTAGHGRRTRIWEVRTNCHCLICGTCLSIAELRKIAAKARLCIPADATDYQIHAHFVQCASEPGPVARLIQKTLDRKYRTLIERTRRLSAEADLRAFWDRSLAQGEIAGPFWALMTHPVLTDGLAVDLFGQVHMLSHLEGSSNRANQRRLHALRRENETLAATLSPQVAESRRRLAERDREIQALRRRLDEAEAMEVRLDTAEARLERHESGRERRSLTARIKELEGALTARDSEAEAARARLAERTAELHAERAEAQGLRRSLDMIEAECDSLAALLQDDAEDGPVWGEEARATGCPFDLSGRSIVYVGGRTGLVAHFRALVEKANGRFIHHDGGIEESDRRLGRLLSQADVVLCPIDCVSHSACARAKQFCKRTARTFVPLRSSGLSSFVNGLQQIASQSRAAGANTVEVAQ